MTTPIKIWVLSSDTYTGENNVRLGLGNAMQALLRDKGYAVDMQVIQFPKIHHLPGQEKMPHVANLDLIEARHDVAPLSFEQQFKYPGASEHYKAEGERVLSEYMLEHGLTNVDLPDIVINSWKDDAPIATAIKRRLRDDTFLVNVNLPYGEAHLFDFIAVPKGNRDTLNYSVSREKVLDMIGVPSHVTLEKLIAGEREWSEKFSGLPHPRLGVCLGGTDAGGYDFTVEEARKLGKKINELAKNSGGSIIVTNSRRTSKEAYAAFTDEIASEIPAFAHDVQTLNGENPFFGMLACCDVLVATGESRSMTSDICFVPLDIHHPSDTNKPCLIYYPEGPGAEAWREYSDTIVQTGAARPLHEVEESGLTSLIQHWNGKRLNTVSHIASQAANRWEQQHLQESARMR